MANTAGHYDVARRDRGGDIQSLRCCHCAFSVGVRALFRVGDRSGQGAYNRARGVMVKHLHADHRADLDRDRRQDR